MVLVVRRVRRLIRLRMEEQVVDITPSVVVLPVVWTEVEPATATRGPEVVAEVQEIAEDMPRMEVVVVGVLLRRQALVQEVYLLAEEMEGLVRIIRTLCLDLLRVAEAVVVLTRRVFPETVLAEKFEFGR